LVSTACVFCNITIKTNRVRTIITIVLVFFTVRYFLSVISHIKRLAKQPSLSMLRWYQNLLSAAITEILITLRL
jgi:hypothetical protein